jgi:hypothetical protein
MLQCTPHLSCCFFLFSPTSWTHSISHAGLCFHAAVCTTLSTGFTTSVMLTHESLLQSLHCPIHEIHSIRHAGSRIPAVVSTLPYSRGSQHLSCWLMNLYCCPYTAPSTRFTVSIMLAHESFPLVFILPHPRDSQHLSCWLMNLCSCPYTTLSTRFTAFVMLAHESLLLSFYYPVHEIHSICHAGS